MRKYDQCKVAVLFLKPKIEQIHIIIKFCHKSLYWMEVKNFDQRRDRMEIFDLYYFYNWLTNLRGVLLKQEREKFRLSFLDTCCHSLRTWICIEGKPTIPVVYCSVQAEWGTFALTYLPETAQSFLQLKMRKYSLLQCQDRKEKEKNTIKAIKYAPDKSP